MNWIPDSLSVKLEFRTPNFSGIQDSVSCNSDSQAQDSGFPCMVRDKRESPSSRHCKQSLLLYSWVSKGKDTLPESLTSSLWRHRTSFLLFCSYLHLQFTRAFRPFFGGGGGGRILVSKQVAKVRCWEGYFQSNPPLHIRELGFLVHLVTQHILCDQMFILDGLSAEVGGREKAKKDCRVRNYAATAFSKFSTAMRCAVVEIW